MRSRYSVLRFSLFASAAFLLFQLCGRTTASYVERQSYPIPLEAAIPATDAGESESPMEMNDLPHSASRWYFEDALFKATDIKDPGAFRASVFAHTERVLLAPQVSQASPD